MTLNNYKRLGDYIREVNVRNRDLAVTKLVGLSIDKIFIPSVANTIGTDMSTYKIIRKGQFACSLMQVSRDGKMPVAMLTDNEAIISPAYPMFEVIDTEILLPEYLMMWFSRSEFDRESSFYAVGGVRGSLTWEDFCDLTLPIPAKEEQQRIVAEYEALSRRIAINEQICAKLEETAQALYRKMLVDGIDPNNLPDGWRMGTIGEFCVLNDCNIKKNSNQIIRYLDSSSVTNNLFDDMQVLNSQCDEIPSRAQRKVKNGDIVYSTVRPNLRHYGIIRDDYCDDIIVSTAFAVIRSNTSDVTNELLYLWITDDKNTEILQSIAEMSKATYPSIVVENILSLPIAVPLQWKEEHKEAQNAISHLYTMAHFNMVENKMIAKLQTLLLFKLATN